MARYPKNATPKLTNKLIEELCTSIRQGCYIESAAAVAGISKDTLYRWLRLGSSDQVNGGLPQKLSYAVRGALAEAELRDLEVIDNAAQDGDWRASAWRLERRFPSRWGRNVKINHSTGNAENNNPQVIVHIPSNGREIINPEPNSTDKENIDSLDGFIEKISS